MKCSICGRETTWDESYGPKNFIACPCCFDKLMHKIMEERKVDCHTAFLEALRQLMQEGNKS